MIQTFMNGGPFMTVLLLLLVAIIFISVKNGKEPYHTNKIILLGVSSAFIGMGATWLGINAALGAVQDISKIAPHILLNGVKTGLITTYFSGFILISATAIWYYFIKKHNLLVV